MNILRLGHNYTIVLAILSHHIYFTDILSNGIYLYFTETGDTAKKVHSSRLNLCLRFCFSPSFGANSSQATNNHPRTG